MSDVMARVMARPALPMGARFLGGFDGTDDPAAKFQQAYLTWRANMLGLMAAQPANLQATFNANLKTMDKAAAIIEAGRGDEVLPNGRTRRDNFDTSMHNLMAAMSDVIPSKWDLFAEAVVQTAKDIRAVAVQAATEGASLAKWVAAAVIVGGGAYLVTMAKPFMPKRKNPRRHGK